MFHGTKNKLFQAIILQEFSSFAESLSDNGFVVATICSCDNVDQNVPTETKNILSMVRNYDCSFYESAE